jgi:hypothetical protein
MFGITGEHAGAVGHVLDIAARGEARTFRVEDENGYDRICFGLGEGIPDLFEDAIVRKGVANLGSGQRETGDGAVDVEPGVLAPGRWIRDKP